MVAGMNRERRVASLEQRKRGQNAVNIPMIVARIGETGDEAVARYVDEHGPLTELHGDQVNVVVFVPVEPARRAA